MAETTGISRVVEDGSAVTIVIDTLGEDNVEVHVIDAGEPDASQRIHELHSRASENTLVMGFFGLKAVIENKSS